MHKAFSQVILTTTQFKVLHYFRTSPVYEHCKRASQAYFSRVEGPVMAIVILGIVSPHSRKIYIQNLYHYQNAFYFCAFHEIPAQGRNIGTTIYCILSVSYLAVLSVAESHGTYWHVHQTI